MRFSGSVGSVIQDRAKRELKTDSIRVAQNLEKVFGKMNKDVRWGGMSLEDVASRLQTLVGVYLLQGYFAVKDDKHPWETNGRNALIWLLTLGLTQMTKSENFGVNTVFVNPWMKQRGTATKFEFMQDFMDKHRMKVDYLDILEDAGIKISKEEKEAALKGKKALWASSWLDSNKVEQIQNRLEHLKGKTNLSDSEKAVKEAIPKFFKRINGFNLASTGLIMGVTVYVIGGLALKAVNKFIAPLDKDFDGNKNKQAKDNAENSHSASYPKSGYPPSQTPPTVLSTTQAFQNFVNSRHTGMINGQGRLI